MSDNVHFDVARVYEAKNDSRAADRLINDYMPFIKSETAKFIKRAVSPDDDELSIAMFAFYEAIGSYSKLKGSFLKFAALHIRHKLIDNYRREKRNMGNISLDAPSGSDEELSLLDTIQDADEPYERLETRDAAQKEIAHLSKQMEEFGVSFNDVAENSPRQNRTLESCKKAIYYARQHSEILDEFLRSHKIPLSKIAEGAGVEKKTLERHRRYLVAVLLICTNGYEIMRGHIVQVLKGGKTN